MVFKAPGDAFFRPYPSPNGKRWILKGFLGSPATFSDDAVILVGGLRAPWLTLWDEENGRLVSFRDAVRRPS